MQDGTDTQKHQGTHGQVHIHPNGAGRRRPIGLCRQRPRAGHAPATATATATATASQSNFQQPVFDLNPLDGITAAVTFASGAQVYASSTAVTTVNNCDSNVAG